MNASERQPSAADLKGQPGLSPIEAQFPQTSSMQSHTIESLIAKLPQDRVLTREEIDAFLAFLPEFQRKAVETSLSFVGMEHLGQPFITADVLTNATRQFSQRVQETRGFASGGANAPKKA